MNHLSSAAIGLKITHQRDGIASRHEYYNITNIKSDEGLCESCDGGVLLRYGIRSPTFRREDRR